MKWRKINRILHRDLGYIFFGMTIIYSVSGIVLNHRKKGGDASIVNRSIAFNHVSTEKSKVDKDFVYELMDMNDISDSEFKNYYFQTSDLLMVYLKDGHISYKLSSGEGEFIEIRERPVLYEFNFLHYNKPKKLWTWFSDIFAGSLCLIAITGLFILKGKNGITRRGAILVSFGIIIPTIFLALFLWTA